MSEAGIVLEAIVDAYERTTQLVYENGLLTTVRDRYGRELSLTYSGNRLWKVRDFTGREWEPVYNTQGRLERVRYPVVADENEQSRQYAIVFGHDSRGNVTSWTDRLGQVWRYGYLRWSGDVLQWFRDPAGNLWRASYSNLGVIDENNGTWKSGSSRWIDPTGVWVEYGFQSSVVARITQGGNNTTARLTTRLWYNAQYQVVKRQDPAGLVWEWHYDTEGKLLWSKKPTGARTDYTYYPDSDRLWKVTDALGHVWEYTYTAYGDVKTVRDPEGAMTEYVYDYELGEPAYGAVRKVRDPLGRETVYEYYGANDPNLARRGQMSRVVVPGGYWRAMDYGGAGWLTRREVQTSDGSEVTTYTHDNWGRLRGIDYPRSADVAMGWDGENRRVWVQDGAGRRDYSYDAWGRVREQRGCCGDGIEVVAVSAEYDRAGRKRFERELNASNQAIRTIETTYDALGRVQTIGDYRGQVVYEYDLRTGRLQKESYPNGSYVAYTYYGADVPAQVGQVWKVEHKRLADNSLLIGYKYTYDLLGRVEESVERPSGDTTVYTYTPAGRLASEERTGQVEYYRYYEYNPDGSRFSVSRGDALNGHHWELYAYDEVSGRLESVIDLWSGTVNSFVWNPEGTLDRQSTSSCSDYNNEGCPRRYKYDEEGRLLTTERWYPNRGAGWFVIEQYQYNSDGIRVWSYEYGAEYRYICGISCSATANRVYSSDTGGWQLYEERLLTPTVLLYGAPNTGVLAEEPSSFGWWLNAVYSFLSGYMLFALTPPDERILILTDRKRIRIYPEIRLQKVKRNPKHWSESWILICNLPLVGMPKGADAILGPRFRHWLIAACGQIFEVPSGSTPKLNPNHPKHPGDHLLPDCDIIPVTPFEKRCICSYASYLQENWNYDEWSSNCQHFVMDVLRACMTNPPEPVIIDRGSIIDRDLEWITIDSSQCTIKIH